MKGNTIGVANAIPREKARSIHLDVILLQIMYKSPKTQPNNKNHPHTDSPSA